MTRATHSKVRGWHQHTLDNVCEPSQCPKILFQIRCFESNYPGHEFEKLT
jgi:hypothetical protein